MTAPVAGYLIGATLVPHRQTARPLPAGRTGGIPRLGRDGPGRPAVDALRNQRPDPGLLRRRRFAAVRCGPRRPPGHRQPGRRRRCLDCPHGADGRMDRRPRRGLALATAAGLRAMFAATGLCTLAQIVPLGLTRTRSARPRAETTIAAPAALAGPAAHPERLVRRFPARGRRRPCSPSPGCTYRFTRGSRSNTAICRSTCTTTCTCRQRSAAR